MGEKILLETSGLGRFGKSPQEIIKDKKESIFQTTHSPKF